MKEAIPLYKYSRSTGHFVTVARGEGAFALPFRASRCLPFYLSPTGPGRACFSTHSCMTLKRVLEMNGATHSGASPVNPEEANGELVASERTDGGSLQRVSKNKNVESH